VFVTTTGGLAMIRLLSIGLVALLALGAAGCASGERSGTTSERAPRGNDRLDPVNAFPQVRDSYMRQ
jgi:hypothetical protein